MKNKLKVMTLMLAVLCSFGNVFSMKEKKAKASTSKFSRLVGWDQTWGGMAWHHVKYGLPGAIVGFIAGLAVHKLIDRNLIIPLDNKWFKKNNFKWAPRNHNTLRPYPGLFMLSFYGSLIVGTFTGYLGGLAIGNKIHNK